MLACVLGAMVTAGSAVLLMLAVGVSGWMALLVYFCLGALALCTFSLISASRQPG